MNEKATPDPKFRLLDCFRGLFEGSEYRHRRSNQGDEVAREFYEDLVEINKSPKLVRRVEARERVLNLRNRRIGVKARRGDASFGESIPGQETKIAKECKVARGEIATIEIGVEAKVLSKAMIKQIDRVISDLQKQAEHFRKKRGKPICVAVIGINHADYYVSYEGDKEYRTTGKWGNKECPHPCQEAAEAERRLKEEAAPHYDEFLILRYKARNEKPFKFKWTDSKQARLEYGAVLTRVSNEYEQRF